MSAPRRVAVIVVAGVGNKPRSNAAELLANGLVAHRGFAAPVEHSEWFKVEDEPIRPVQRFETGKANVAVDVYEFWWADLSRFPLALRSFLAALTGLFLAFPSIGRTALRDAHEITAKEQPKPRGSWLKLLDYHLLGLIGWFTAVPIIVLTGTTLITVGGLTLAIALDKASANTEAVALGLYGAASAYLEYKLLRRYGRSSGRRRTVAVGALVLPAAATICAWRLVERGTQPLHIELALADTVSELVTYPLRITWLVVVALAFTATVALAIKLLLDPSRRARTVSAVVTIGFGPLGIAALMAIFAAAVGAAGERFGKGALWTAPQTPLCLTRPDDWSLSACSNVNAWDFGGHLLANAIYPLAVATAVALGTVALIGVAMLVKIVRLLLSHKTRSRASVITGMLGALESPLTCGLLVLAALVACYAAAAAWLPFLWFGRLHLDQSDTTWGPTIAAVLGGVITALLLAARALGLSPQNLAKNGAAPGPVRTILDKAYDIATFLREPFGSRRLVQPLPRTQMLERYAALLKHVVTRNPGYDRVVFAAHSQGTILTVTLLAGAVPLPDEVSLLTFGCPLRQLYLRRFPSQYGWVEDLVSQRKKFVTRVTHAWVNVAAPSDPIGRTVFCEPPETWRAGRYLEKPGDPELAERLLGQGGHSSYWTADELYEELDGLIS